MSTLHEEDLLTKRTIYASEKLSTLGNRFIYTMEKINFGYSMKNIETPQNKTYLLQLIEKIEMVFKRMRWKVLCNGEKETNSIKTEWYGLKSSKTPKQVKELIPFENDLIALEQNIIFRKTRNHFQKKIQKDIQLIESSDKTVTFADKNTNLYQLTKAEYDHMINNATSSKYKKASNNIRKQINIDGKQILKNREVLNRLEINCDNNSFITLKDHKENFNNNPTELELGHISKAMLDTANKNIREAMGLNQWRNTDTVIDWFKGIRNKHLCKIVIFDIEELYASITENVLEKAIIFAEAHTLLSDDDKAIIHHAKKSLLFNDQQTWIKRDSGLFDVTMGAYDGAEVCELVGNYLLYKLLKSYEKKDIGLYKDEGLAVLRIKVDQNQKN